MNIRDVILYSHAGEMRRVSFKVNGLNIVTGRSSTGKSSLSDIVEYCMGRSDFNIPEGPIRDKVSWYAVIFQFAGEQVLIAKPAPAPSASSCSRAMIRRGATLEPPLFHELHPNADDDTVVALLSELLGIPSNRTDVPHEQSRDSYIATIKHTYFYLFQKQGLITNKEQLFYLGSLEGMRFMAAVKTSALRETDDLDDFEVLADVVIALPQAFTQPELQDIGRIFSEFAVGYPVECTTTDPEEVREEAIRIGTIGDVFKVDTEGVQDELRESADEMEKEQERERDWDPDYEGPSGSRSESCSDGDLDSMFGTLGG